MAGSSISVSRNFTLKTDRLITPEACRQIGLELLVKIENRTISGRDEMQTTFTPYSESYARRVKGRRAPVDLKHTGQMLGDMDVLKADGRRIVLGFRSSDMAQRARYHDSLEARRKMPLRRFLGLQPSWVTEVFRRVRLTLPPIGQRRKV